MTNLYQNLNSPRSKWNARSTAARLILTLWTIIQSTLFSLSPSGCNGWRCALLRLFGAKIGRGVIMRPSARIARPWKLSIGDYSWVGDAVNLYNLGRIDIGQHAVISQHCYLCTGSHDYRAIAFPQTILPIRIENEAWLATDVFVAPGVTVGKGAVVGARTSIFKNVAAATIVAGTPARVLKTRAAAHDRDVGAAGHDA